MRINPLTTCDFYKVSHRDMYPKGTEMVYSNFTPRSARLCPTVPSVTDNRVVFFGLQGFMEWFLIDVFNNEFFNQPKEKVVRQYKRRMDNALGPDMVPVDHIEALHDLGYLPLEIMALPEGSKVDVKTPLFTVFNTDSEFAWLVNYLETVFSNSVWKSSNTATIAYKYRQLLDKYAALTGTPAEIVGIQGHDFSCRGQGGPYDAAMSGAGHLAFFEGTDTISAIDYVEDYYGADSDQELVGCSVPATEHSVMCMGGKEDEVETFRRLLGQYPEGILAIVSDTWDFWKVVTEYAAELKDEILARQPNGLGLAKTVFRPDSGDPVDILCGTSSVTAYSTLAEAIAAESEEIHDEYQDDCGQGQVCDDKAEAIVSVDGQILKLKFYVESGSMKMDIGDRMYWVEDVKHTETVEHVLTPAEKGAVQCLYDVFGGDKTETGHILLNERVGLIYGDSITLERCEAICQRLAEKGFASGNVVFGIGSFTYQYNTRDTLGFAMKATYGEVNGEGREIFKDPVTDSGTKKSAKGLLVVEEVDGPETVEYALKDQATWEQVRGPDNAMRTVFRDSQMVAQETLATIRERARQK